MRLTLSITHMNCSRCRRLLLLLLLLLHLLLLLPPASLSSSVGRLVFLLLLVPLYLHASIPQIFNHQVDFCYMRLQLLDLYGNSQPAS